MASSSQKIEASFSPQIAEAMTILRGLQLALDTGLSPCRIDSDAEVIVNWINIGVVIFSKVGSVIDDIRLLLDQVLCVSFNFVPRTANQVAHMLAKNGLACDENLFWLEEFPSCVGSLVLTECRTCL
ncbi:hypothetical protein Ddye_024155 [Dipteronia dyeriana]|uniref:RNase H type-1 domain-containing protein n=1 Tax=Dipteronia dyeriana TaxID=168575 RepID=A0AAD9WTZ9_9ROSI|nr:hypothetical protein Ddye_024155 [Dipteronia dyeriana]